MSFRPFREPLSSEADPSPPGDAVDPVADGVAADEAAIAQEPCRRCRKPYPVTVPKCPACGAGNPACPDSTGPSTASGESELRPLNVVMTTFGVMLLLSVAFMVALAASPDLHGEDVRTRLLVVSILEAVDTLLVAVAGLLLVRVAAPRDASRPFLAWALAGPALVGTLAVNIGYHALIRSLGIPTIELPFNLADPQLALWGLVSVCIQPALVEEWFFRGIVWKSFRQYLGVHGTVWVVAVMFGMAHIGVFLSVPVLILIGGLLGYARLYSGGLLLPIVLHFLHNLLVSLWGMAQ